MSVCALIVSDHPLPETAPEKEYPVRVDIDRGEIDDGGADDNFFLRKFDEAKFYTGKEYGVCLEWNYYTEGRARKVIGYIKNVLEDDACVELWRIWLTGCCEYEESPVIHVQTVSFSDLSETLIKEIDDAEIWNTPDRHYPHRPSFYRLIIRK